MCGPHVRPRVGGSESSPRISESILVALRNLTVNEMKHNMEGMERSTIPSGLGQKVTTEDVEKVHILIEHCIELGKDCPETCYCLSFMGVDPKVTEIVWKRLESENADFFTEYKEYLRLKEEKEQQEKEAAANNAFMSRCDSACSLSSLACTQVDNNAVGNWHSPCF